MYIMTRNTSRKTPAPLNKTLHVHVCIISVITGTHVYVQVHVIYVCTCNYLSDLSSSMSGSSATRT